MKCSRISILDNINNKSNVQTVSHEAEQYLKES